MKVYRLEKIPVNYLFGESAEFNDSELEDIKKLGADVVFYWYAYGGYEGCGQILFKINDNWYLHNAAHCSCFGPTDHIKNATVYGYDSLNSVLENCSDDYKKQIEPLIKLAKSKRYK